MRSLATALIVSFLLAATAQAKPEYPDTTRQGERAYPIRTVLKLSRGLMNITFFWIEPITNPIKEGWQIENAGGNTVAVITGMAAGVITGTAYAVARVGSGAFDLASFPLPNGPLMNPETPFSFFETLGADDAEHHLAHITPPHRIDPEPSRRINVDYGL
jgi:putative exosortase-associated protein (TIGR04073 family)